MTDTNELRKLLNAATPTPWAVSYGDISWQVVGTKPNGTPDPWTFCTAFDDGSAYGEYAPRCTGPTRDLIVAAINGLPAMLDELDAARAEVERAKRALLAGGYTDHGGQDWKPPIGPSAARLLAELDDVRTQLHADDQRAWEALGKPEGTYDTTNVQRLCAEVERLRDDAAKWHNLLPVYEDAEQEVKQLRADLREAMELLQAHGEPPNWLRQAWLRREPGDDTTAFHTWNRRYGKLLAKHKETP